MAGGSCQEMGPAVDFFSSALAVRPAVQGPNKLAGPKRPFLPPTGEACTAQGRACDGRPLAGLAPRVLRSRDRSTRRRTRGSLRVLDDGCGPAGLDVHLCVAPGLPIVEIPPLDVALHALPTPTACSPNLAPMLVGFAATVTEVHCNNCGADWWTKASAIGTLVGLAFAGAAFWIAIRANNTAKDGLQIAQEEHAMTKTEHEEFLIEIGAQPDLAGLARCARGRSDAREWAPSRSHRKRRPQVYVRLVLGLSNAGSAPLRDPALNLLIPQIVLFRRIDHDGGDHPEGRSPERSQERLRDARATRRSRSSSS